MVARSVWVTREQQRNDNVRERAHWTVCVVNLGEQSGAANSTEFANLLKNCVFI